MMILLVLFSIFFVYLAVRNLWLALCLLIFLLPAYVIRFQIGPLPSTALELMIWLVFAVWFFKHSGLTGYFFGPEKLKRFLAERKNRGRYPFRTEIILLLLVSYLAVAVGGFDREALGIWKAYFFDPILFFVVFINAFGGLAKEKIFRPIYALAGSAFAVSLVAIYQKFTGLLIDNPFWAVEATRRATSVFGYPNAVGLYLGPIMMLSAGLLIILIREFKQNFNKENYFASFFSKSFAQVLFIFFSMHASLLAIFYAKSEGAIIGVAAGLVVMLFLSGKRSRQFGAVLAVSAIAIMLVSTGSRELFIKKITLNDFSGQIRRQQWHETWQLLTENRLILGAGLANYQTAIAPFHQPGIYIYDPAEAAKHPEIVNSKYFRGRPGEIWQPTEIYLYPHNIALNFWSELGLAGALLFLWIFGKYFYIGFKFIENWKLKIGNSEQELKHKFVIIGLICAMVVIVIHGLVDVPYFKNDLSVMFWLMVGLLGIINIHHSKTNL